MFTGIVQGRGRVEGVRPRGGETRLVIHALFDLPDIVQGESIAVNGACLTVERSGRNAFDAFASAETLRRTNLGRLKPGDLVNLERALALGDRLGGHLVSGHVDCSARVAGVDREGESRVYRLEFPEEYGRYVVCKGSVCLDGISLTVNDCGGDWLSVNIIPTTQRETTISQWALSAQVNMEVDLVGRYVERLLASFAKSGSSSAITEEFLRRNGF